MKKIFFLFFMLIGSVYAQDQTTGNLVYTTVNPAPTGTNIGSSWTGFSNVTSTGGNTTGDSGAITGYNPNTGTFMFGYNQGTIYYTYAINQALANAGTGIRVRGYNWSWEINNLNYDDRQGGVDTLNARITTFAANNTTILQQEYWTYNTKFDWTTFSGTVNYNNLLSPAEYGNMQLMFSGRDSGFWAGYYGPMVRNISLSLNYTFDQCSVDPLSSTSCPGYEAAFLSMQCSANPLYSSSCPGYAQAFYTQQCTINPLYDSGCPGYAQANYDLQCSLNPLYDTMCPGYQQAYFNQQCNLDGLYNNQCPNYAEAYAKKSLLSTQSASSFSGNTEPTVSVSSDGTVSTDVKLVEDENVNKLINETATSASPSPTSTVQLSPQGGSNANTKTESSKSSTKEQTASTSSAPAQNRRQAALQAQQRAQQQAKESLEQAANATSMEAQVAVQANVVAAMGFVPGFSAYQNVVVPDTLGRELKQQYNKPVVDNVRAQRRLSGASDRLHQEMISDQYNR